MNEKTDTEAKQGLQGRFRDLGGAVRDIGGAALRETLNWSAYQCLLIALSYGGIRTELAALKATIARFVELGGQVIDTAPSYGKAEEVIGLLVEQLGVRDRLFLATKVGVNNREEGVAEIERSFTKLRTKRIDLIAVHNLRDIDNQLAILRDLKAPREMCEDWADRLVYTNANFDRARFLRACQP